MKKFFSKSLLIVVSLLSILVISGCSFFNNDVTDSGSSNITDGDIKLDKIIDREGNEVDYPKSVDKIISIAPSITEILVDLGLADNIIAVDKYSVGLPGIGEDMPTFDIVNPNVEQLAVLQPDIIFASGLSTSGDNNPLQIINDMGIYLTVIPSSDSIKGIRDDIIFISQITGTEYKGEEIIAQMDAEMNDILDRIPTFDTPKTVYFEISSSPSLYSFGNGVFLNEMIGLLGGKNILDDHDGWVSISDEIVLERNPNIIFTNIDYVPDPVGDITSRNGWGSVVAVKDGSVYQIDKNSSARSNHNILLAFKQMAKAMHPEIFADYE